MCTILFIYLYFVLPFEFGTAESLFCHSTNRMICAGIQIEGILDNHESDYKDVAAIITAMTDGEESFLFEALEATLTDPSIGQVILCIEEKNAWVDTPFPV